MGIHYELREYEVDPDDLSAETVAAKVGLPPEQVFKTLAVQGDRYGICLAVISADNELDFKALAKQTGEYTSRFSSSVSLSYRPQQTSETARSAADSSAQLPLDLSALEIPNLPASFANNGMAAAQPTAAPADGPHKKSNPNFNQASGKDYVVFEGTVLETVLVTRLNGDFSGLVICMLTNNIYSHDGLRLLIPAGTKVLGETKRVEGFGQTRLAVVFHRLIMPDGYSGDLDQFQGLNQIGETGLKDKVNHHYLQIFGASIAVGAIGGLAEVGTNTTSLGLAETPADAYRQGVATSLSQ